MPRPSRPDQVDCYVAMTLKEIGLKLGCTPQAVRHVERRALEKIRKLLIEKNQEKGATMYDPIYSQNIGLCGFRCRVGACTRVVRSYKGIVMHCKRKHGLVAQMKLFDTLQENNNGKKLETTRKLEPVRVERDKERGLFYDEHGGESRSED